MAHLTNCASWLSPVLVGYCLRIVLFQLLQIRVLNRAIEIRECLSTEYASFAPEEQLIALAWIREHWSEACNEVEKAGEDAFSFKQDLKKARLVRCSDRR